MTGQNLIDLCEIRFRDTANAIVSEATWLEYLNLAVMDVNTADPYWPFLEARATNTITTSDSGEITLPTDVFRVTAVYNDTDGFALEPLDGRASYRSWYPEPASNLGTPVHYRLRANVIEVFPHPSASTTIIVDYFVSPAAITTSTEPSFPEAYHRMLVSGALAYAYEDDGQPAQAQLHRVTYDRLLQQLKQDLLSARSDRYSGIVDLDW